MNTKQKIIRTVAVVALLVSFGFNANASMYSRKQARKTIEQTSYIINQAYEIASYYSFWQTNNVSRAMYYNNYAQDLYFYHLYRSSIRYSLLAREYALDVIDNCDDYWEFFYYTYYGWSMRYGYNYNFAYINGYRDGYYDGYYARYCSRHRHDYRRDPHRNMHNEWYTDQRYNDVSSGKYFANNGDNPLTRGNTGKTGSSSQGGTTVSRPGYTGEPTQTTDNGFKNIVNNNYYSQTELAMLNDVPSATVMENDFRQKNPSVSFSDENLSSKTDVIKRNQTNSNSFATSRSTKTTAKEMDLQRPTSITLSDGKTVSGRSADLPKEGLQRTVSDKDLNRPTDVAQPSGTVQRQTNTVNTQSTQTPARQSSTTTTATQRSSAVNTDNSTTQRSTATQRTVSPTRNVSTSNTSTSVNTQNNNTATRTRSTSTTRTSTATRSTSTPTRSTSTSKSSSSTSKTVTPARNNTEVKRTNTSSSNTRTTSSSSTSTIRRAR
ncbi:MAG: hypothetical protein J6M30_01905 [Bacteroidales bacterium]|nr:hypothetical protein [Bacteroidales bacterium]